MEALFMALMTALFISIRLMRPVATMTGRKNTARKNVRPGS